MRWEWRRHAKLLPLTHRIPAGKDRVEPQDFGGDWGELGTTEMRRKVWEQGGQEGMRGEQGMSSIGKSGRGERERGVSPKEAAALG